ncbi:MAG: hypothetical protein PVJ39_10550 [Gammaproteobacteria bacterium]|jgi:hypothetical protein
MTLWLRGYAALVLKSHIEHVLEFSFESSLRIGSVTEIFGYYTATYMFGFLQNKPVLDEESIDWMFDCYAWALSSFNARVFKEETVLVLPTNDHFPGQEQSPFAKATLILDQVKRHACMAHWPLQLVDEQEHVLSAAPQALLATTLRGDQSATLQLAEPAQTLSVVYQPALLENPQAMIANYAQMLAHYLGTAASDPPPGGVENWPHIAEVVAVFLGFGLMFANTAHHVRASSCGSCQRPVAQRENFLSQYDITYALAIFSALKDIPVKSVTPYLKKTLHGYYKQAVKDVNGRDQKLQRLGDLIP